MSSKHRKRTFTGFPEDKPISLPGMSGGKANGGHVFIDEYEEHLNESFMFQLRRSVF